LSRPSTSQLTGDAFEDGEFPAAIAPVENGDFTETIVNRREAISLMSDIDRRLNYERRLLLYEGHCDP
jgi:hypothetical protein